MLNKNYRIIGGALLFAFPLIEAAPVLEMYVFEEKAQTTFTSQEPQLEMHVFDSSPALQNNAEVAERYTRPQEEAITTVAYPYVTAETYIKTGYRQDDLDWTISSSTGFPNILSELTWSDIEIATLSAGVTLYFDNNWLVNLDAVYGHIYDGDNQDSDYRGDNRTGEFSRSNNSSDDGSILDLSVSTGYNWIIPFNEQSTYPNIELRPQVGLSYYSQNFTMTDGNQTLSTPAPEFGIDEASDLGPFAGLHSSYDSTWISPWFGLKSKLNLSDSFTLGWNLEYHYAEFDATANWNLRSDFEHPESYKQEAKGYGIVTNMEGEWAINDDLSLNLSVDYSDWQADRGGEVTFHLADGTRPKQIFNGVNWKSFGANIGIVYDF